MSKYSLHGSLAFDERVEADMKRIVDAITSDPQGDQVNSIVLLGGYGRGEGTPFKVKGTEVPFNDYDLVVVVNLNRNRRFSKNFSQRMQLLKQSLKKQLGITVDLYVHCLSSLKRAECSLLNYEMQNGHRVLWGNPKVLEIMPKVSLEAVSLSEGSRLLMNRGKLLLDIRGRLRDPKPLTEQETVCFRKFLWKNHLAFGDCLLLLKKEYDVLYRLKAGRIQKYEESQEIPEARWMISLYQRAVAFKQRGEIELLSGTDLVEEWYRTKSYWLEFFLWFEGARLGVELASCQDYCNAIALREPKSFASVLRNFSLLGGRMVYPSVAWACVPLRKRLCAALYLLLQEKGGDFLLAQLLGGGGTLGQQVERFYAMRLRCS